MTKRCELCGDLTVYWRQYFSHTKRPRIVCDECLENALKEVFRKKEKMKSYKDYTLDETVSLYKDYVRHTELVAVDFLKDQSRNSCISFHFDLIENHLEWALELVRQFHETIKLTKKYQELNPRLYDGSLKVGDTITVNEMPGDVSHLMRVENVDKNGVPWGIICIEEKCASPLCRKIEEDGTKDKTLFSRGL